MMDTDGDPVTVRLTYVLYLPYVFSVSQFAQNYSTTVTVNNFIYLTFIDCTTYHWPSFLSHSSSLQYYLQSTDQKKQVTNDIHKIGTLHHRFGHTVLHA
jgi:hypothetical protein